MTMFNRSSGMDHVLDKGETRVLDDVRVASTGMRLDTQDFIVAATSPFSHVQDMYKGAARVPDRQKVESIAAGFHVEFQAVADQMGRLCVMATRNPFQGLPFECSDFNMLSLEDTTLALTAAGVSGYRTTDTVPVTGLVSTDRSDTSPAESAIGTNPVMKVIARSSTDKTQITNARSHLPIILKAVGEDAAVDTLGDAAVYGAGGTGDEVRDVVQIAGQPVYRQVSLSPRRQQMAKERYETLCNALDLFSRQTSEFRVVGMGLKINPQNATLTTGKVEVGRFDPGQFEVDYTNALLLNPFINYDSIEAGAVSMASGTPYLNRWLTTPVGYNIVRPILHTTQQFSVRPPAAGVESAASSVTRAAGEVLMGLAGMHSTVFEAAQGATVRAVDNGEYLFHKNPDNMLFQAAEQFPKGWAPSSLWDGQVREASGTALGTTTTVAASACGSELGTEGRIWDVNYNHSMRLKIKASEGCQYGNMTSLHAFGYQPLYNRRGHNILATSAGVNTLVPSVQPLILTVSGTGASATLATAYAAGTNYNIVNSVFSRQVVSGAPLWGHDDSALFAYVHDVPPGTAFTVKYVIWLEAKPESFTCIPVTPGPVDPAWDELLQLLKSGTFPEFAVGHSFFKHLGRSIKHWFHHAANSAKHELIKLAPTIAGKAAGALAGAVGLGEFSGSLSEAASYGVGRAVNR